nr:immunoglobulin light chain junction region [Macaca mulatta]
CQQYNDLVFTC